MNECLKLKMYVGNIIKKIMLDVCAIFIFTDLLLKDDEQHGSSFLRLCINLKI